MLLESTHLQFLQSVKPFEVIELSSLKLMRFDLLVLHYRNTQFKYIVH